RSIRRKGDQAGGERCLPPLITIRANRISPICGYNHTKGESSLVGLDGLGWIGSETRQHRLQSPSKFMTSSGEDTGKVGKESSGSGTLQSGALVEQTYRSGGVSRKEGRERERERESKRSELNLN